MEPSTEEIRRELDLKRDALTRDVEQLEAKVKHTLDIRQHISERPLLSVGLAVLGGLMLGRIGGGRDSRSTPPTTPVAHGTRAPGGMVMPYGSAYGAGGDGASVVSDGMSGGPGLGDQVRAGVQDSLQRGGHGDIDTTLANISAALTALLVDKARDILDANLPGFTDQYDRLAGTTPPGAGATPGNGRSASAMGPSPYTDPLASAAYTTAAAGLPGTNQPGSSDPV